MYVTELTAERRVASNTLDEGAEDGTDPDTRTGETDGGETGTLHLGRGDDGGGGGLGDDAARLHGATHHGGRELAAGAGHEQAIVDGLLAGRLDERARDASGGCGC